MSAPSNSAKQLLAAAVLEVFPGAHLVGGEASEFLFSYDFHFPAHRVTSLGQRELVRIEDHMRLIAHEARPIKLTEMMRENAHDFLVHIGQPLRADAALESLYNIIPLFEMGAFRDPCAPPFVSKTSEIKLFKLLGCEQVGDAWRITGAASGEKETLKAYIKKYKVAKERDHRIVGPKLGLFTWVEGEWTLLPKGELIWSSLIGQWRALHEEQKFVFTHAGAGRDQRALHELIFRETGERRIASISDGCDLASIFCRDVEDEFISSLQFIDKVIKIFGFEARLYCASTKKPIGPDEATAARGVEFHLLDCYGRGWRGPSVYCREGAVHRLLFGSLERWICLLVENGSY